MANSEEKILFEIKAVESIPCDVRNQSLTFDAQGQRLSEPLRTPWPMPWIEEELRKYVTGENQLPEETRFQVDNPEEPDQFVVVTIEKTV